MSRKSVPKHMGGILLDELLAAHAAGDARFDELRARYGGSVVAASTIAPKPSANPKRRKATAKKASRTRFDLPQTSQVIPQAETRLVGFARVSTDEQTTALQLDALRSAG